MSLEVKHLYEFGEFRLDMKEKILTRRQKPVALTPKVFEMLCVFVENRGRLIEKEELMEKIWADSFVEDSNLTFNIRQLRKALGDSAQQPRFIQTVPRHGYRFIAEVREIAAEISPKNAVAEKTSGESFEPSFPLETDFHAPEKVEEKSSVEISRTAFKSPPKNLSRKFPTVSLAAACLVVLSAASLLAAFIYNNRGAFSAVPNPILNAKFTSEQLTNAGGVYEAVISPDGKLAAYSNEIGGKTGIWIRRFETGENFQIIPNADEAYYALSFSRDSRELYFSRGSRTNETHRIGIFRVSIFGGIPQQIVADTYGWFSVSPDDRQISFIRCARADDDYCSLFVADRDGGNERKLLTRPRPIVIRDNQFSPDGKRIAAAVGQARSSSSEFGLLEVDLATGVEREITKHKFSTIHYLRWLPDQSALLLTAFEPPLNSVKIFQVSTSGEEIKVLTGDSSVNYDCLSLDRAGEKMVTTQTVANYRLWLAPFDQPQAARPIATAAEAMYYGQSVFVFAPGGKKIVFASAADVNQQIWTMNADGSEQRQLTTGQGTNWQPRLAPDGSYILFASNRSGAAQIWRMNLDGSNQTRVTEGAAGSRPIHVSADGKTVYFESPRDSTLGKIVIGANGETVSTIISDERMFQPAISPDETRVAYFSRKPHEPFQIALMSLADAAIVKSIPLPEEGSIPIKLVWSPDGDSLFYASKKHDQTVVWRLRLETGKSEIYADLGAETVSDFAFSSDGKSFAFTRGKALHDAFLITGLK
jgi:Tol biopolymer transport system component/DNA-binding winged helix-turn-helix (wHTH) protein